MIEGTNLALDFNITIAGLEKIETENKWFRQGIEA
jgi:hypothetical protein